MTHRLGFFPNISFQKFLRTLSQPKSLFALAFVVRVAAIPLAVFRVTPYSQADATGFSVVAGIIAQRILSGTFSTATRYAEIYEIWGSVLSPFWFLPVGGPILARIVLSLLAAFAVYNSVLIARRVGTPMAGLVAGLPLAVYPTIVLVESTLLREATILFGITTAARLLLIVSDGSQRRDGSVRSRLQSIALVVLSAGLLAFATILRTENVPLYVAAVGAAGIAYYSRTWQGKVVGLIAAIGGALGGWVLRDTALDRFNFFRDVRSRGRTAYLGDVHFDGLIDMIQFAPTSAVYFLFAPFPWMVDSIFDLPIVAEAILNVFYAIAAIAGVVVAFKRDRVAAVGLGVFFLAGVTLYGLGTANYGTATRHRQMFLWVLFIFGGVGAHWLWLRYAPAGWKAAVRK